MKKIIPLIKENKPINTNAKGEEKYASTSFFHKVKIIFLSPSYVGRYLLIQGTPHEGS